MMRAAPCRTLTLVVALIAARGASGPVVAQSLKEARPGAAPTLPPPDTTHNVTLLSRVIGWPDGKTPIAPPGFRVNQFAGGLQRPRWLYVLPNGDVLVAESANNGSLRDTLMKPEDLAARWASGNRGHSANRITLLRDADGDGVAEQRFLFLSELNRPVGMALVGDRLYVANTDALLWFPYRPGDTAIMVRGRKVIDLPGGGYNNHWTRNVVARPDGQKLYVSVGSATNVDVEGIDAKDERRAAILELNADGSELRVFAGGLRNPVGMDWAPGTTTLWTVVNERDGLGDELVPDYLTSVRPGGFYGWPYSYFGSHQDPRQAGRRPDLVARAIVPDLALGAHTASLGLHFYRGGAFPAPFNHGAFVGQRGSWNRSQLAGYRVLFVPFKGERPVGSPMEFLGGFRVDDASADVHGRPVGIAELPDGSLLVADDPSNRVWRVSYGAAPTSLGAETRKRTQGPTRIATIAGLSRPEGARYDPDQDVWFLSVINAVPRGPLKDNNGFIARVSPDGAILTERFVAGGVNKVTLHAPKGMVIVGDTLWVADVDAVRGFHRRTGEAIGTIDFAPLGALFLNDICVGPDGLYVTDTGVAFDSAGNRTHPGPDRIFRIRGRQVTVAFEGNALGEPNGITWDAQGRRFLIAPIAGQNALLSWRPGRPTLETVATGPGRYDGVERLADGRILVTAWNDSTLSVVSGSRLVPMIRGLSSGADLGVDLRRRRVLIPLIREDRAELWQLPH